MEGDDPPMSTPKFKRNQKWRTRDGRLAVIDTVRGISPEYPIQGRVRCPKGEWSQESWSADGAYYEPHKNRTDEMDLIAPWPTERKARVVYVNEYDHGLGSSCYPSQERADAAPSSVRIGCVKFVEVLE
jgi:hypothetical protein